MYRQGGGSLLSRGLRLTGLGQNLILRAGGMSIHRRWGVFLSPVPGKVELDFLGFWFDEERGLHGGKEAQLAAVYMYP